MTDYSLVDHPNILRYIFYPRKDFTSCPRNAFDLFVTVEEHVFISCRFYLGHHEWPWILFFHGNGEVVSDYDEIFPFYHQRRLNLVVADYRGYGASRGVPTVTHLVQDAHMIFREVRIELSRRDLRSDLYVMGRSLGSISALELSYQYQEEMKGLIIESGFPSAVRILEHLGISVHGTDFEKIDQECLERMKKTFIPSLIIHGEQDTLVPLRNARDLYEHLGTQEKELLIIPSASHNDIIMVGLEDYFKALQRFIGKTDKDH